MDQNLLSLNPIINTPCYLMGTFGFFVPHLIVIMNPSIAITTNWLNVIKFPLPGSALEYKPNIPLIQTNVNYYNKSTQLRKLDTRK